MEHCSIRNSQNKYLFTTENVNKTCPMTLKSAYQFANTLNKCKNEITSMYWTYTNYNIDLF